jgi:hypothetical protein
MPAQKHVHKYFRKRIGKDYIVYACALPDCSHYLHESHIVGKRTVCWVCGRITIVYRDSNGILARPHCKDCTKKKKDDEPMDLPPLMVPNIFPG